ncbi:unnamed protein product [Mycena citricolor]|uniref:Uncharacterized protein n=1 Tax=Mycena citricolor TaxID=2018698 RepID=A0AAD2JWY0_9AGAR|nr:unnamed protein product [Mycena citricolor]
MVHFTPRTFLGEVHPDDVETGILSAEHQRFNQEHKGTFRFTDPRTIVVLVTMAADNVLECVLDAHQLQHIILWNQAVHDPDVDPLTHGFKPVRTHEVALAANGRDPQGWASATWASNGDLVHGAGHIPSLCEALVTDARLKPTRDPDIVTISRAKYEDGREAIIGRDQAQCKARECRMAKQQASRDSADSMGLHLRLRDAGCRRRILYNVVTTTDDKGKYKKGDQDNILIKFLERGLSSEITSCLYNTGVPLPKAYGAFKDWCVNIKANTLCDQLRKALHGHPMQRPPPQFRPQAAPTTPAPALARPAANKPPGHIAQNCPEPRKKRTFFNRATMLEEIENGDKDNKFLKEICEKLSKKGF